MIWQSIANPMAEQGVEHNVEPAAVVIHPAKAGVHAKAVFVTTAAAHLTRQILVRTPVC